MNSFSFRKGLHIFSFVFVCFGFFFFFSCYSLSMVVYLFTVLITGNGELVFSSGEGARETFTTFYEWSF